MKRIVLLLLFSLQTIFSFGQMLYIYGGENQDVYLGKFNAYKYDSESIWNDYGKYGNRYNSNSIWNEYGRYGSETSSYSPFNKYAVYPPILVDANGNCYGFFTINEFKHERAEFDIIVEIYKYYEFIREDVGKWFDKLF